MVLLITRATATSLPIKTREIFRRPPQLTSDQIALDERLVSEGTSVREAAKLLKCPHATLYRALTEKDRSLVAATFKGDVDDFDFQPPKLGAISRPADLD